MSNQCQITGSLQVLIVDSDPDSRELLVITFAIYGIRTIAVASADEALKVLSQVKPDLLISEISLPHEDGYSLMSKVKALEVARQVMIPTIALSTYTTPSDRDHALAVGFRKHLAKPCDLDELITTVASLTQPVSRGFAS